MKAFHLLAVSAAMSALLVLAAAGADAQRPTGFGTRPPPPSPGDHGGGKHGGFHIPFLIVQRDVPVIIEREVVREVPAEPKAPPEPPAPPRGPYVVGKSYSSLPDSCMKLIEGGASYYYCGGEEWYRGAGKKFLAVRKP